VSATAGVLALGLADGAVCAKAPPTLVVPARTAAKAAAKSRLFITGFLKLPY
jgi:hypothetical protein